jgi:hypothetical protein
MAAKKKDAFERLRRALRERGYNGPANGPWLKPLEPGISARVGAGWLQLGQGIDVSIGVRHDAIEDVLSELDPLPNPRARATATTNMTSIVGRANPWFVPDRSAERDRMVAEIVEAIEGPGAEFVDRHRSAADVRRYLDERATKSARDVHMPALLLADGDDDEAARYVRDVVASLGDRDDIPAEHYRAFAKRVEQRLTARASCNRQEDDPTTT